MSYLISFLVLIFISVLVWKINLNFSGKNEDDYKKEELCSHCPSDPEKDRLREKLYLISGWDCDYCGKRINWRQRLSS